MSRTRYFARADFWTPDGPVHWEAFIVAGGPLPKMTASARARTLLRRNHPNSDGATIHIQPVGADLNPPPSERAR